MCVSSVGRRGVDASDANMSEDSPVDIWDQPPPAYVHWAFSSIQPRVAATAPGILSSFEGRPKSVAYAWGTHVYKELATEVFGLQNISVLFLDLPSAIRSHVGTPPVGLRFK